MAQSNGELRQELTKLFKSYSVGVSAGMSATRAKTIEDTEEHLNAVLTLAEQLFEHHRKQHELEARLDEWKAMGDFLTKADKEALSREFLDLYRLHGERLKAEREAL